MLSLYIGPRHVRGTLAKRPLGRLPDINVPVALRHTGATTNSDAIARLHGRTADRSIVPKYRISINMHRELCWDLDRLPGVRVGSHASHQRAANWAAAELGPRSRAALHRNDDFVFGPTIVKDASFVSLKTITHRALLAHGSSLL